MCVCACQHKYSNDQTNRFEIYTKNEVAGNETPQLIPIQSDFRLQKFRYSYETTYATEMMKIVYIGIYEILSNMKLNLSCLLRESKAGRKIYLVSSNLSTTYR